MGTEMQGRPRRHLYMISQHYPYGNGEVYLERELEALGEEYETIFLFPLVDRGLTEHRRLPKNVVLCDLLTRHSRVANKSLFVRHFPRLVRILRAEYRHTSAKAYVRSNLRELAARLSMGLHMASEFAAQYLQDPARVSESSFYSVWMDEGALMFGLLKQQGLIPSFVFRLHGYDLYDDRREGGYMPFQAFCFEQASRIFVVSRAGRDYLAKKGKCIEKLEVNYSGVFDRGMNPLPSPGQELSVFSCSNLVPLKRVSRIPQVLEQVDGSVRWTHIGDGPELPRVRALAAGLPSRIEVHLPGALPSQSVLAHLASVPTHVMLHLSETEGLPMAIVEAQSFGIPAIATDVGGTSEIVSSGTGILLPRDFADSQVVEALSHAASVAWANPEFRECVKREWGAKFDADTNYRSFVSLVSDQ